MTALNAKVELDVKLSKEEMLEVQRQNVWIQTLATVASANDCKKVSVAISWADDALEAFDARFNK